MDLHLELVEVEPVPGLLRVQIVVEVPGRKPEAVEAQFGSQQQTRRALLIGHPGVAALPAPVRIGGKKKKKDAKGWKIVEWSRIEDSEPGLLLHHVYGLRVLREAEGVAAGGRPKVYRHDNRERTGHPGSDLHPLRNRKTAPCNHPWMRRIIRLGLEIRSCFSRTFSSSPCEDAKVYIILYLTLQSLSGIRFKYKCYYKPLMTVRSGCGFTGRA